VVMEVVGWLVEEMEGGEVAGGRIGWRREDY
jgi:hypothetical protein